MRRVKKTTNEQFDLLKAEMALHPAAARGYGVGAQRIVVDAEWKEIVEKLNALGPPERTMTEWKKVWSDVRLRIKKQSMGHFKKSKKLSKPKKLKKEPIDPAEDQLMEALNSSISIYGTHIKTENSADEQIPEASQDYESYDDFEGEESKVNENNYTYNKKPQRKLNKSQVLQPDDDIEQTLASVQKQLEQQTKLMNNLLQVSSNMTVLMKRYMKAEEKKTTIMQRQLKSNEYHNLFARRQETRKKFKCIKQHTD